MRREDAPQRHRAHGGHRGNVNDCAPKAHGSPSFLCDLCVLCASVVNSSSCRTHQTWEGNAMSTAAPTTAPFTGYLPVREDWLSRRQEPILEPELPIVDPHHHLWDRAGWRYLLPELLADT